MTPLELALAAGLLAPLAARLRHVLTSRRHDADPLGLRALGELLSR